jgi:hypothetical protein
VVEELILEVFVDPLLDDDVIGVILIEGSRVRMGREKWLG